MKRFTQVTEPHIPPLDAYVQRLQGIWERRHLTNSGPLANELEVRLKTLSDCSQTLHCLANGGLALQILIRAMGLGGEIITTPYSYIATTSCSMWQGLVPVFADIDEHSLCIDPASVESLITPSTEAVLATHVFGNPCDVLELERICRKHGLALIYDAAHAFGVRHLDKSILDYGDGSIMSLHATKVIHSVEGGFTTTADPTVAEKIEWMRRFGHNGHLAYHGVGINAKISELHAAMGLCILDEYDSICAIRRLHSRHYRDGIEQIPGVRFAIRISEDTEWNNCYLPVLFETEERLVSTANRLLEAGYGTRRYFYPTIDRCGLMESPEAECPVAHDLAERVLCLPLSTSMNPGQIEEVLDVVAIDPAA
jgi:dTDP-4-amino-4,6-dideoxygalactose transaminase